VENQVEILNTHLGKNKRKIIFYFLYFYKTILVHLLPENDKLVFLTF